MQVSMQILVCMVFLSLQGCSDGLSLNVVKEDRTECPSFLDVELLRQSAGVLPEGDAHLSVWDGGKCIDAVPVNSLNTRDTSFCRRIYPRHEVKVFFSSHAPEDGAVMAEFRSEMPELFVRTETADCSLEETAVRFEGLDKRYVRLSLTLNDDAKPYAEDISVTVEAPYAGVSFPDMAPVEGAFSYTSAFNPQTGSVTVRIPPQGGAGLRLVLRLKGAKSTASYRLYDMMTEAGFRWDDWVMRDFNAVIGLNSASMAFRIVDWTVVDLDRKDFD